MGEGLVIDIDSPNTWPEDVAALVEDWCRIVPPTANSMGSLGLSPELEDDLRVLVANMPIRAYHCTRLLGHEADSIGSEGLRKLTPELVEARISLAEKHGHLMNDDAKALRLGNSFVTGNSIGRADQVCVILSANQFDYDPGDCAPLLRVWGGEGMHGGPLEGSTARACVRSLGRPAIIQVTVKVGEDWQHHRSTPGLHQLFVGRLQKVPDLTGVLYCRGSIPAEQIEAIWHPGTSFYDRFAGLPSE